MKITTSVVLGLLLAMTAVNVARAQHVKKLVIITTSLPTVPVGTNYNAQLHASGGKPPYVWAITSGALPPGLTLSTGGAITGVPTTVGDFGFVVQVTDSGGATARMEIKTRRTT